MSGNAKCAKYYTPLIDGLKQPWTGVCWMNPPYGRQIGNWLKKAYEESLKGATIVCLIPARTDTKYWHEYCMKASEIRFIKGRLKFTNKGDNDSESGLNSAPFPSAIIVFNNKNSKPLQVTSYIIGS